MNCCYARSAANINFILKVRWNMKKTKGLSLPDQKSFYAIGAFLEND